MRFALSLCLLIILTLPACAGEFTVGFGEVDLTPEVGRKRSRCSSPGSA